MHPLLQESYIRVKKTSETIHHSVSRRGTPLSLACPSNEVLPEQVRGWEFEPSNVSFSTVSVAGGIPQWEMDEFLGLTDFSQNYDNVGNGSSKVLYISVHLQFHLKDPTQVGVATETAKPCSDV